MVQSAHSREKRGFTTNEAAHYIGRSPSWLRKKRLRGSADPGDPGPPYFKTPTGAAIYLREGLDSYLDDLALARVQEHASSQAYQHESRKAEP
jgi:hypothetical protein